VYFNDGHSQTYKFGLPVNFTHTSSFCADRLFIQLVESKLLVNSINVIYEVPAHKALYSCVRLSQGRLLDPTWKRRPGCPRGRWIDQLRRDNNRPPADQWKLAIKRGHDGRAMLRSHDYATT